MPKSPLGEAVRYRAELGAPMTGADLARRAGLAYLAAIEARIALSGAKWWGIAWYSGMRREILEAVGRRGRNP